MIKTNIDNAKIGKRLMILGLIGLGASFSFWLNYMIQEHLIKKKYPELKKIHALDKDMQEIDEKLDSSITFREVIHFSPQRLIRLCTYLRGRYQNLKDQRKLLASHPNISRALLRKKKCEKRVGIAGISFLGFLLLFRIGADHLWPPLADEKYSYWLTGGYAERIGIKGFAKQTRGKANVFCI